jgi:hypothetical protein
MFCLAARAEQIVVTVFMRCSVEKRRTGTRTLRYVEPAGAK